MWLRREVSGCFHSSTVLNGFLIRLEGERRLRHTRSRMFTADSSGPSGRPEAPAEWQDLLRRPWSGLLLLVGGPDTGKTTLSRFLYDELNRLGIRTARLDGDPGQSTLGPPATMTVELPRGPAAEGARWLRWRRFVGAVSPRGHMLPLLVSGARLLGVALEAGAQVVVYDTSGLVDPAQGGTALKWAKIDLLEPRAVLALQRERELEALLGPLRRLAPDRLIELAVSASVTRRTIEVRRAHRAARFGRYFRRAEERSLSWEHYAVFPASNFVRHGLVGLENADGFLVALGIVLDTDPSRRTLRVLTPARSLEAVRVIRVGRIWVDPWTFQDGKVS